MSKSRTRYSIEIRSADGVVLICGQADCTNKESRERLAGALEPNVYPEPALQPEARARRPRQKVNGTTASLK
jgi:hypothetical protein